MTTALITTNGATENEDEYTDTLPNGMVWGALVAKMYGPSVVLQQFDPTTNTATAVTGQPKETNPDPIDYLNLPNGQVMITVESGSHNWVLTPDGQPQDAWRPTVTSVVYNSAANNYTLTGTQISGLINGGDEGDDMTMAENYPIIWLKDSSGNVTYCKSFNFSNMMPSKGSAPETADFTLPSTVTTGSYQLYVSAVGVISKTGFPFTVGQSTTTGAAGASGSTGGTTGTGGATGGASGSSGLAGNGGKGGTTGSGGTRRHGGRRREPADDDDGDRRHDDDGNRWHDHDGDRWHDHDGNRWHDDDRNRRHERHGRLCRDGRCDRQRRNHHHRRRRDHRRDRRVERLLVRDGARRPFEPHRAVRLPGHRPRRRSSPPAAASLTRR